MLDTIPADIVLDIIQYLDHNSVTSLERTCRYLRYIVETYGWKIFLRKTLYYSPSLSPYIKCRTSRDLARQLVLAQQAWQERKFVARPLGPEWNKSFHPLLALHNRHLIVGVGNSVISYNFKPSSSFTETTRVCFERVVAFPKDARKDITGIGFHNHGEDLILSFVHGGLARINLENVMASTTTKKKRSLAMKVPKLALVKNNSSSRIKDLSICGDSALAVDSSGTLSLFSLEHARPEIMFTTNPFEDTGISEFGRRPGKTVAWSNYLSLTSSSTGYAVVGISSHTNPLSVFNVSQSAIHSQPCAYLSPSTSEENSVRSTAVYAITGSNNFNNLKNDTHGNLSFSDQIVLSGWYHGVITMYDLRCPTRLMHGHTKMHPPTLLLQDPLAFSSIYSLSMADYRVAAGSAHYSLLQLYDLRAPQSGFSIYLPQGRQQSSPVYSTVMESTRIWAGTESHALGVDFGKTSYSTFPTASERHGVKVKYDAPIYEHSEHRLHH